jgi:hypothetical protein
MLSAVPLAGAGTGFGAARRGGIRLADRRVGAGFRLDGFAFVGQLAVQAFESSSMPLAGMPIQIRPLAVFSKRCAPVVVPRASGGAGASSSAARCGRVAFVLVDRDLVAELAVVFGDDGVGDVRFGFPPDRRRRRR